jgi:hypothetical protein
LGDKASCWDLFVLSVCFSVLPLCIVSEQTKLSWCSFPILDCFFLTKFVLLLHQQIEELGAVVHHHSPLLDLLAFSFITIYHKKDNHFTFDLVQWKFLFQFLKKFTPAASTLEFSKYMLPTTMPSTK